MNPIAESLTGWSQKEAVGRNVDDVHKVRVFNKDFETITDRAILNIYDDMDAFSITNRFRLIIKDGTEIPISETASPIKESDGQILGASLNF